jgi:hypothetical protein
MYLMLYEGIKSRLGALRCVACMAKAFAASFCRLAFTLPDLVGAEVDGYGDELTPEIREHIGAEQ